MATNLSFDDLNILNEDSRPFAKTDSIVRKYTRLTLRKFNQMKTKLADEDDLYVMMEIVYGTYANALDYYGKCLVESANAAYRLVLPQGGQLSGDSLYKAFSTGYASLEGYVPRHEWERKRGRAYEAVVAAKRSGYLTPTKAVKQSLKAWTGQLQQSADDMTIAGMNAAYSDAAVEELRYMTVEDSRVCSECRTYDQKVYKIGDQPSLPIHFRCRCFYVPVK